MPALPRDAWDTLIIDGKECAGCFYQREVVIYSDSGSGRDKRSAECWIEMPKCSCPDCPVYCGSEVKPDCGGVFNATEQGTSNDPNCIRWYLDKACDAC